MRALVVADDKKKYKPIHGQIIDLDFAFGTQTPTPSAIMKFNYALVGAGISNQKALLLVEDAGLIRRIVELPMLKKDNILSYIQLNSRDYFPMDIEDYIINGKVIQKQKETMVVVLTLIPKALIQQYKDTLKQLGLKNVEMVYDFALPEEIKPIEDNYLAITILGQKLQIQYTHKGEVVYSKGEELSDLAFDTSGVLVRCDDYITSHYGKSVYTLPVVVQGTQQDRECVKQILLENFNNTVVEKEIEDQEISIYEYGYLGRLNTRTKKGKYNKSHIEMLKEPKETMKAITLNVVLGLSTIAICMGIFHLGNTLPKNEIAVKTSAYDSLVILEEGLSESNEIITRDTDYKQIVAEMDTYNNHFFTLIEELRKNMPLDFIITAIAVSETGVDLKVQLDSLESCGATLEKMDALKCATPGEVTTITELGDGYSFSISLQYTEAMKSER